MAKEIKEISLKNTKEQILAAYNEALEQTKNKQITPLEEKAIITKTKQVEEIKQYGYDKLNNQLNQIGSDFLKSLEVFSNSINSEYEQFTKLQNAIELEQQHLNDLYSIKENANTLSATIIANEKQKEEFEIKMESEETQWQSKLTDLELDYKTKKIELERQRKREEDEYNYNLTQKRRIETDKYEQERQKLLKELSNQKQEIELRENSITQKEVEFAELQNKVANIEKDTIARIKVAESEVAKSLQQEFKFTQALKEEQSKRSVELLQQKIESLQQKITEQDSIINNLNNRLQLAQEQSQQIAHKALETSIQRNVIINPNENQVK
jgi:hypothetical protein